MSFDYKNHIQNIFGCSSKNFEKYPEIWMKNIESFIPFLNYLIKNREINKDVNCCIKRIKDLPTDDKTIQLLFEKYKSDKCRVYWPLYTEYLKKYKNKKIRLLEIGLGTNNPDLISSMGNNGKWKCGSSLRSFRDYLPNADIFGADIDKESLFNEDRIKTTYVDQLNSDSFLKLKEEFDNKKFDVIIDDGLHSITANLGTIAFALNNINEGGTIIIEDICISKIDWYISLDFIIKSTYKIKESIFFTYRKKSGFIYVILK